MGPSEPPSPLFSTERNQTLPFSVLSSSGQSLLKSSNGQLGSMAEKPHMCNLCATGQLCGRMQTTLSRQKRFQCHLCDIFFPLEKFLDTHVTHVHRTLPLRSNPANILQSIHPNPTSILAKLNPIANAPNAPIQTQLNSNNMATSIPQNIQPNTISILANLNPIANAPNASTQTQFNPNNMAASILQTIQPDPTSILAKLNPIADTPNAPIQTQFNQTNMASRTATTVGANRGLNRGP